MSTHRSFQAVVSLVAIVLGVCAALLWTSGARTEPAFAVYHCTRYAPVYSVDNLCTQPANFPGTGYWTNGVALRDSNMINMTNSRNWEFCHFNQGICVVNTYFWGTGMGAWSGVGSQGYYAQSWCWHGDGATYGFCATDWHT